MSPTALPVGVQTDAAAVEIRPQVMEPIHGLAKRLLGMSLKNSASQQRSCHIVLVGLSVAMTTH